MHDMRYERWGDEVAEDYCFYPDGFGTRVVTLTRVPDTDYVFSEFIVLTPQAAFQLDVSPAPKVDLLFLDGETKRIAYPLPPGTFGGLTIQWPSERDKEMELHPVERLIGKMIERGKQRGEAPLKPGPGGYHGLLGKITLDRPAQTVYRVLTQKEDPAAAIYFSPHKSSSLVPFLPVYDRGELLSPAHWGGNWPLSRRNPTVMGRANDEHRRLSPNHIALMDLTEPEPLSDGRCPRPFARHDHRAPGLANCQDRRAG